MSFPLCASDDVVMIRLGADALSRSSRSVVSRNGARWFNAHVRSMPSTVSSRCTNMAPALLMSTSMRGYFSSTWSARARIDACEVRSACRRSTVDPPSPSMLATASAPRASSRATMASLAPRRASAWAAARPMPRVAPVIRTRLSRTPVHSVIAGEAYQGAWRSPQPLLGNARSTRPGPGSGHRDVTTLVRV